MCFRFRAVSAALSTCIALAPSLAAAEGAARPPAQYVVISFDGAHDLAQWKRSRALAAKTGARFTYFLSCVFLLSPETKTLYRPPDMKRGRSNVGFAATREEVAERLAQIWSARREGHEIASHGCGHFDGKDWSAEDWRTELAAFRDIVSRAYADNGIAGEPEGWQHFAGKEVRGFRAPYLSTGGALFETLAGSGYAYDASTVSRGPAAPRRKQGLWRFALPQIPEGPSRRRIIAMDYNLFVRHSGGIERQDADGTFEERAYQAFHAAFEEQYAGDRTPLQIGFHFTLMNGGAYWRALERFAAEACAKTEVRCVTYRGLVEALETERAATAGG